ncbi:MAG: penicillin-binding protein activator [Magnetococcales bacterium]|nr:penicillin-binding protein activator [Magnetococcales bacterium]MBF0437852.1 penicillin-binding protein activator [Magnetococcales bacterium]
MIALIKKPAFLLILRHGVLSFASLVFVLLTSAVASPSESYWETLIKNTLNTPLPDTSKSFIQKIPPAPTEPQQIRELFLALEPLSREQIKSVLDRQPQSSPLLPFLHLILGDRAATLGEEKEAQALWKKATLSPVVNAEAMLRIANDSQGQDPLVVGLLIPMSGQSAGMGNNLVMAARKALADYRDVNLHLEVADSGGTAESARLAVENLLSRGSKVIIGPVFHPEAMAAAKSAAAKRIPIITLNPRHEILTAGTGGFTYLNAFQPEAQARIMARHAIHEAGLRRFAILAADSDYGKLQGQTFANEIAALGGIVTHSVLFPEQETDFSTALKMLVNLDPDAIKTRLTTARASSLLDPLDRPMPRTEKDLEPLVDFEALFLPVTAKQARLIAPQAVTFNIHAPNTVLLGVSLWNRPELLEGADALNGAIFCDSNLASRDQFNAIYQKILGVAPVPALSMLTYDSIAILAQLLRDQRLGGVEWQKGLNRENGFHGSTGLIRFQPNGISERFYHLYRIEEKKFVSILVPPQNGAQDPNSIQMLPTPAPEEHPQSTPTPGESSSTDDEPESNGAASATAPLPSTTE